VDTRAAVDRFLASPALADATRRAYRADLRHFAAWLERERLDLDDVDARALADYAAELGRARSGLAPTSATRRLAAVRSFLRFTLGAARVPEIPLAPRRGRRLPDAPKRDEVDTLLSTLEGDGPLALRNRALVEVIYSAGLRCAEVVALDLGDVDFERESGSPATSARRGPGSRAARSTRSSSRRGAVGSTRASCGASCRTRTGCATRSRPTSSRAAPTCARSRSCSATRPSRRRRSTATSTRRACAASTTAPTRARDRQPRVTRNTRLRVQERAGAAANLIAP
jgi:hypothetical protein